MGRVSAAVKYKGRRKRRGRQLLKSWEKKKKLHLSVLKWITQVAKRSEDGGVNRLQTRKQKNKLTVGNRQVAWKDKKKIGRFSGISRIWFIFLSYQLLQTTDFAPFRKTDALILIHAARAVQALHAAWLSEAETAKLTLSNFRSFLLFFLGFFFYHH